MSGLAAGEPLHLYEEFLLLVLRDDTGVVHWRAGMWQYALGGALLADLALSERVGLTDDKRPYLVVRSNAPLGDDLLDDCLARIASARRRTRAETWVSRFAQLPRLQQRAARSLCRRGILKADERQFLLIFRRTAFPELDSVPERRIVVRLRRAVTGASAEVDSRTSVLIALLQAIGGLRIHFDAKLLRENRSRIKQIVAGERIGGIGKAAIEAAHAAVAACTAAIMAATATG